MEWKKNVNTNFGITIILIFSALFVLIDFYLVGSQLDGYPFNDLGGNVVNSDDDTVVENRDIEKEKSNDNTARESYFDWKLSKLDCKELDGNNCLLVNDDNLKISIYNNNAPGSFEILDPSYIMINDNKLSIGDSFDSKLVDEPAGYHDYYQIDDVKLFDDGYIYVHLILPFDKYSNDKAIIIDSNANVVTNVDNLFTEEYNPKWSVPYITINGNEITYTMNGMVDGIVMQCIYREQNNFQYSDLVYSKYVYSYVGNGKLDVLSRSNVSLQEYINEKGYNNCDDLVSDLGHK